MRTENGPSAVGRSVVGVMDDAEFDIGQTGWEDDRPGVWRALLEAAGQPAPPANLGRPELPAVDEPGDGACDGCGLTGAQRRRQAETERMRRARAARSPREVERDRARDRARKRAVVAAKRDIDAQVEADDPEEAIDWLMRQRPG